MAPPYAGYAQLSEIRFYINGKYEYRINSNFI